MSGFADVYQRLCERHPDPHDRGRAFEPLVKKVLTTAPTYRERFGNVWRWSEWPGRDNSDIGIDIVAERHDGGLVAIQCKCQDHISKGAIDSFLADSQRQPSGAPYVERYIITTATEWSDNAEMALTRIDPPVQRVDFFGLDGMSIDWVPYLADEYADLRSLPRKQLRPHQVSALNDVLAGFAVNDRGKLIMACGTGKTLTSLRIAEQDLVGPRLALEWLIDRYRVTTHRASGIVNDPNDWGTEMGDSRYIIDLVKRVTTVSVETMAMVKVLPSLEEA